MLGTVSVVVMADGQAEGLVRAFRSVAAQTRPVDEVVVVGDGAGDAPSAVGARHVVRVARPTIPGPAAARNAGLRATNSDLVLFLDPEEVLTPVAVAAGLEWFRRHPEVALVHGLSLQPRVEGPSSYENRSSSPDGGPRAALLQGRAVPVHASVLYRREALVDAGGFDEDLTAYADYDVHLRLARTRGIASHPVQTASTGRPAIREPRVAASLARAALRVHARHRPDPSEAEALHVAWARGRATWRTGLAAEVMESWLSAGFSRSAATMAAARVSPSLAVRTATHAVLRGTTRRMPRPVADTIARLAPRLGLRPRGRIRLGDLANVRPVSLHFGFDRGTPLDRHYIEGFLLRHAEDVRGRVLEVADATYSQRFGGERIDQQDVLHVSPGNPDATIVGDVTQPGVLPPQSFDCIVFTQTLHLVFDMAAAVRQLYAALRPGGVLLLTVPGISQIDRSEWGSQWFWSLTPAATRRLLGDAFGPEAVHVEGHGNAFAATAFLQGLALEEVDLRRLEPVDPAYPVIVTARAVRLS